MRGKQLAVVLAAFSIVIAILAAGLRPDAFFVGDPGVKLVVARNAVHSPARPLDIPLPLIGTTPTPHVDPFFFVHDGHAHAVTSEFFPLASAPLLRTFGLRGLYVWPALGFLGALAATAWLACALDPQRNGALTAAVAALGTPLLFYGLEFWEHAPAVAAATAGAALLVRTARRTSRGRRTSALFAGVLFGVAVLLRPEAVWFAVSVAMASRALPAAVSWRDLSIAAAGAALALAPLEAYAIAHFGAVTPGHVSANAALLGSNWWPTRGQLALDWLLPSRWAGAGPVRASSVWSVAPAAVLALGTLVPTAIGRGRAFLWVVACLNTAGVLLTAPNNGGGQWGPRYLLFSYVPLAILAADTAGRILAGLAVQEGRPPSLTARTRATRWGTLGVVAALVASGVWVQRAGYRQLRGTKATYGRIVDFVAANTSDGGHVVSDLWWLDQVAAAALDGRTFYYASDSATGQAIVRRLGEVAVDSVIVIRSLDVIPAPGLWSEGTCYAEESRSDLPVRSLVAIRLRYRCGTAD